MVPLLQEQRELPLAHEGELGDEGGQLLDLVGHLLADHGLAREVHEFLENIASVALLDRVELHKFQSTDGTHVLIHETDTAVQVEVRPLIVHINVVRDEDHSQGDVLVQHRD